MIKSNIKSNKAKPITQEELQIAIRTFEKKGGIILKLPDQKTLGQQAVSMKWGHTEAVPDAAP
jgi:hypothetical protein